MKIFEMNEMRILVLSQTIYYDLIDQCNDIR